MSSTRQSFSFTTYLPYRHLRRASCELPICSQEAVLAFRAERESLIGKIAELQRQQLNIHQEAQRHGWTPEQSALAFDTRFARIAWLVRELTKLDEEGEREWRQ